MASPIPINPLAIKLITRSDPDMNGRFVPAPEQVISLAAVDDLLTASKSTRVFV